jgi:hypothetical protein
MIKKIYKFIKNNFEEIFDGVMVYFLFLLVALATAIFVLIASMIIKYILS